MENACGLGGCGDVYVETYSANLYLNGTLEENFVYGIERENRTNTGCYIETGKYRFLTGYQMTQR